MRWLRNRTPQVGTMPSHWCPLRAQLCTKLQAGSVCFPLQLPLHVHFVPHMFSFSPLPSPISSLPLPSRTSAFKASLPGGINDQYDHTCSSTRGPRILGSGASSLSILSFCPLPPSAFYPQFPGLHCLWGNPNLMLPTLISVNVLGLDSIEATEMN